MPEGRTAPLIAAKQVVPPVRPGAVRRARLHAPLLDNAATRLSVVVAPAGWGKTTLLSQWAHDPAETRGVVWVSLDETDDDPVRFWTYVLTALQRDVAGLGPAALRAQSTPGLEPVDLALPTLLNELAAVDTEHVLVLDDFHLLRSPGVHESLEFLLAYLPPALRVVIAARADPPLPLARLRARGELTELRAADLGFRADEAGALLTAVGGPKLDAVDAAALRDRTEGWAAGLQLAALTVRDAERPAEAAARLDGAQRHILDYLSLEVVDRLDAEQRDLLVRASELERLSGPLCDAALDRTGSAAVLDALDRADLFVTPLDPQRRWYRCHRLFRDVLRRRLAADPDERGRVHAWAADWFLARGHVAEAVGHRMAAGDEEGAAELLRSRVPTFLERGELAVHLQLGRQLPAAAVRRDARLCVSLAWAAGLSGQFAAMGPWLTAADEASDDDGPVPAGWHTLRGAAATLRGVEHSIVHADMEAAMTAATEGCRLECDPTVAGYVMARTVLGAVLGLAGRPDEAVRDLDGVGEGAAGARRGARSRGGAGRGRAGPRRGVGPGAGHRAATAAGPAGREHPGDGARRDRPDRPAPPVARRGRAGGAGRRGPVGDRDVAGHRAPADRRGRAGPPRRGSAAGRGAAATCRRPRAHLRRARRPRRRARRPRRGGARRPRPRGGPGRPRGGPGRRRERPGRPGHRPPAGRSRTPGGPDGGAGGAS